MSTSVMFFITAVVILLALLSNGTTSVESSVDRKKYLVLNLPDKLAAADELARLRAKLQRYIADVHQQYNSPAVRRLKKRFRAVLSETRPKPTGGGGRPLTSYTIDKGKEIHMCIRDADGGRITRENTLFFVALHELAHIMTVSVGHTEEFWSNFRQLLKYAIRLGYYQYEPYHSAPARYCGSYIRNTPLQDV